MDRSRAQQNPEAFGFACGFMNPSMLELLYFRRQGPDECRIQRFFNEVHCPALQQRLFMISGSGFTHQDQGQIHRGRIFTQLISKFNSAHYRHVNVAKNKSHLPFAHNRQSLRAVPSGINRGMGSRKNLGKGPRTAGSSSRTRIFMTAPRSFFFPRVGAN
jgi:hypothetical protein